jgi:hypothetical protein
MDCLSKKIALSGRKIEAPRRKQRGMRSLFSSIMQEDMAVIVK